MFGTIILFLFSFFVGLIVSILLLLILLFKPIQNLTLNQTNDNETQIENNTNKLKQQNEIKKEIQITPSETISNYPTEWLEDLPYNKVSSLCLIIAENDETHGILSIDKENIYLTINQQITSIQFDSIRIENVSMNGKKISKKNLIRIVSEKGIIYRNKNILNLRLKSSYEFEYWERLLKELCFIAHQKQTKRTENNQRGREYHEELRERLSYCYKSNYPINNCFNSNSINKENEHIIEENEKETNQDDSNHISMNNLSNNNNDETNNNQLNETNQNESNNRYERNEKDQTEQDKNWCKSVNLLFNMFAHPFISNPNLPIFLKSTINNLIKEKVTNDLEIEDIHYDQHLPVIKNPIVQITDRNGEVILDTEIDYQGDIGGSIGYTYQRFGLNIHVSFKLTSLKGNIRLRMNRIPSSTVWFTFHDLPEITFDYNVTINNYSFVKFPMIEKYLKECIHIAIIKTCFSPQMIPIHIPDFSLIDILKEKSSNEQKTNNKKEKKEIVKNELNEESNDNEMKQQKETIKEKELEIDNHKELNNKENKEIASEKISLKELQDHQSNEKENNQEQKQQIKENQQKEETKKNIIQPIPSKMIDEGKLRLPQRSAMDKSIKPYQSKPIDLSMDNKFRDGLYNSCKSIITSITSRKQPPSLPKKSFFRKQAPQLPDKLITSSQRNPPPQLPPKQTIQSNQNNNERKQPPSLPPKNITKTNPPPLPPKNVSSSKPPLPPKK